MIETEQELSQLHKYFAKRNCTPPVFRHNAQPGSPKWGEGGRGLGRRECALISADEELVVTICAGGRGLIAGGGGKGGVKEKVVVILRRSRRALAVCLLDQKPVRAELPQYREPPQPDRRRHDPATGAWEEGDETCGKRGADCGV